jgi:hypothetical protein
MIDPRARRVAASTPSGIAITTETTRPSSVKLGGRRQPVADFGGDRLARGERIAEIAMGEIVGVAEELLDQRLVETEFLPDLLDRFLGGGAGPAK